jgi:hypothetical protein
MTLYPMAWAPLMLLLTDRYHRERSLASLGGLALVSAMVILAGFQQMAVYLLYITMFYSLYRTAEDRYTFRWKRQLIVLASLAAAGVILCLAGLDPLLVYSLGVLLALFLFFASGNGFLPWMRASLPVAAAMALGLGLAAVQMVPVFTALPLSMRNLVPPETMVNDLSITGGGLLGLLFPLLLSDPMWKLCATPFNLAGMTFLDGRIPVFNHVENSLYIGLLPLAFIALLGLRRIRKGRVLFFTAATILLLAIGLGLLAVIYPMWWLPGYQTGDPRRSLLVFSFFAGLLAAYGYDGLISGRSGKMGARILGVLLLALAAASLAGHFRASGPIADTLLQHVKERHALVDGQAGAWQGAEEVHLPPNVRQIEMSLLLFALASGLGGAALLLVSWKPGRITQALVCLVLLIDLGAVSWHVNRPQDREGFLASHPAIEAMQAKGPHDHFRIFRFTDGSRQALKIPFPPNMTTHFGIEDVEGYVVQPLKRYFTLVNAIQPDPPIAAQAPAVWPISRPEALGSPIMDLIGVKYLAALREVPGGMGFESIYEKGDFRVYLNREAFPRAFLVTRAHFFNPDDPNSAASVMNKILSTGIDLRREAVLEAVPIEVKVAAGPLPEAMVSYPRPEEAEITFPSPPPASILVLTDAYFPGWKAFVDGQPAEIMPAYHAFRAVAVPEGARSVIFRFEPPDLKIGSWITLASALLTIALFAASFIRKRISASRRAEPDGEGTSP